MEPATTIRLPRSLRERADALAAARGISLNALIAVALGDYLEMRRQEVEAAAVRRVPVPGPNREQRRAEARKKVRKGR